MSTYTIHCLRCQEYINKENRSTSLPYYKNDEQYKVKCYFQKFAFNNWMDSGIMIRKKKKEKQIWYVLLKNPD